MARKFFGEESFEDFMEFARYSSDFTFIKSDGEEFDFHLDPYGEEGVQVYYYDTKELFSYDSFDELFDEHVFPDGVVFRKAMMGD